VGEPTLAMECEKWNTANVSDIYGGLPPGKILHVRSSERAFLDTFTMLLKYLPTGFKEIVVDCSIRVADCSIRVS